ncbi:hypothetical protein THRCLA_00163 [Thraustotheca clavata]|uniref:Uncharacterized protein n=1 Tax=Thraustotheca clavata TaxID=74557 RepID=A0A1W0ACA2_9STRA|nr:hypothetical protein THRCLA_00163 [Thraustotheca clavata]
MARWSNYSVFSSPEAEIFHSVTELSYDSLTDLSLSSWYTALQNLNLMVNNLTAVPSYIPNTVTSLDLQSHMITTRGVILEAQQRLLYKNFIIHPGTYSVLLALESSCSTLPISTDPTLCSQYNVTIETIWTNNKVCVIDEFAGVTSSPPNTPSTSTNDTGIIVGVVVTVVVVIAAIATFFYCRRKKTKSVCRYA